MTRQSVRFMTGATVIAVIIGIVTARTTTSPTGATVAQLDGAIAIQQPVEDSTARATSAPAVPASTKPSQKVAQAPKPKADIPLAPLVAPGRTDVGNGLYIERAGETVTVHFDTPQTRTRRRDKFERVVRQTLPEIYGSAAEALLSAIPEGALVDPADLVTEIAERGVRLDAGDGWKVALWPETRPGQDGPLVVSYRVAVTR